MGSREYQGERPSNTMDGGHEFLQKENRGKHRQNRFE